MSADCSSLFSLPPELISVILSYLSPVSACQLEMSSKQAGAAVINTAFWKKYVECLSMRNEFVNCLRLKVQDIGYEGGEIFKLIVRADWKLRKMVRKLKRFAFVLRKEITYNLYGEHEDEFLFCGESGEILENGCKACKGYKKKWNLEIFPGEKSGEFVEVVKYFMQEGINIVNKEFIHSKKGPEPALRLV